jgi:dihydrofolate reductase
MRKIMLQINVSLDGFIEDANHEIDWHFVDDEFEEFTNDTLRSIDGMIFGRVAYQLLADYWPTAALNPKATKRHVEAARMMNELPKFVVSKTLQETHWDNSFIIRDNLVEEISRMKRQPGKDIALFAGAKLASSFMQLGLIDEYRIILNPALLGDGTPLFTGDYEKTDLRLLEARTFKSGAVVLTYRPENAA